MLISYAATSSFDAAMDSLLATSAHHRQRVKDLEGRLTEFRELLRRLDDVATSKMKNGDSIDDKICMIFSPATYESALEGMESELAMVRDELSTSNLARSACDASIKQALLSDVKNDDGQAVPSDAWLDQAGSGVMEVLKQTNEQRVIPMLLGDEERFDKGEADYQYVLDKLLLNASSDKSTKHDHHESIDAFGSGGGMHKGDDESVYSLTSQMSSISVTSSSRMTAGQRKRWHKQQQQMQTQSSSKATTKASSAQLLMQSLSPHPEERQSSTVAGRQQSLVGSHPYLCENFHDSYGIGREPPKGLVECSGFSARGTNEGGTEFYTPSNHVTDLHIFNTNRNSYGITKTVVSSPSVPSNSEKIIGGVQGDKHEDTSTAAVKKEKQSSGSSANKSLAQLVFNADSKSETNTKPELDLPASLPQEM